jgi:hypothetical protein
MFGSTSLERIRMGSVRLFIVASSSLLTRISDFDHRAQAVNGVGFTSIPFYLDTRRGRMGCQMQFTRTTIDTHHVSCRGQIPSMELGTRMQCTQVPVAYQLLPLYSTHVLH